MRGDFNEFPDCNGLKESLHIGWSSPDCSETVRPPSTYSSYSTKAYPTRMKGRLVLWLLLEIELWVMRERSPEPHTPESMLRPLPVGWYPLSGLVPTRCSVSACGWEGGWAGNTAAWISWPRGCPGCLSHDAKHCHRRHGFLSLISSEIKLFSFFFFFSAY